MRKPDGKRRQDSLTRERVVDASITILDEGGEKGLTFQALAKRLKTGAGAIYWHVENKSDLMVAASDAIVIDVIAACSAGGSPADKIRALALDLFDALDERPWLGSALAQAPGSMPTIRIFEHLGRQVRAMGVPHEDQWTVVAALLNYVLGVGGQNAANAEMARMQHLERDAFLGEIALRLSALDPKDFPFVQSIAPKMPDHDDRADFLTGIDLFLDGIARRVADSPTASDRTTGKEEP
jgi:AcrR family transcriptional regulator